MSWKENRPQNNSADYIKFTPDFKVGTKEENGKMVISLYSPKEKKTYSMPFETTFKGISLGYLMSIKGYDKDTEEGYRSTHFINKQSKVVVFDGKGKLFFKGTAEEAEEKLSNARLTVSKKANLFMAAIGKTDPVILEFETSLPIIIDQYKNFKPYTDSNICVLRADQYSPENPLISKKTHEVYNKKAILRNPPYYFDVSMGEVITSKFEEACNIEKVMEDYSTWYNSLLQAKEEPKEEQRYERTEPRQNESFSRNTRQEPALRSSPEPFQNNADKKANYDQEVEKYFGGQPTEPHTPPPTNNFAPTDDLPF